MSRGADLSGFARELERTIDRLRTLGGARLRAPHGQASSPADLAYGVAVRFAGLAEEAEAAADGRAPVPRALPRLAPTAAGDQLAVTGHDLLLALERLGSVDARAPRWVAEADAAVRDLRRALP